MYIYLYLSIYLSIYLDGYLYLSASLYLYTWREIVIYRLLYGTKYSRMDEGKFVEDSL